MSEGGESGSSTSDAGLAVTGADGLKKTVPEKTEKKTVEFDPAHDVVFIARGDGSRIVSVPKNDGEDLNENQSKMALLMLAFDNEEAMAWLYAKFFPSERKPEAIQ